MSNGSTDRLNEALGQLEDELEQIKSARDQVEGMISSNADLSASLGRLIDASRELVRDSNDQSRGASEALAREADRLAECSGAIEKAATAAVERASSEIAGYANQAVTTLSNSLDEAKNGIGSAIESLESESSEAKKSRGALLEAYEAAAKEQGEQTAEAKKLLEEAQKHLVEIDARLASLKDVDLDTLVEELRELKDTEANNTTELRKKLTTVTAMVGACVVLCLAALAKLFIG